MMFGVLAVLALFAATIDGTVAGADETGTCGEFNFGFSGTNLINDGISDSAGPFPINLAAGTYDVTLRGEDDHTSSDADDQPGEQWYVALDNGWQSDLSDDIPDDVDMTSTVFSGITIEAATAISVHHAGEGNVNSLRVVCVGFTPTGADGEAIADDCTSDESEMTDDEMAADVVEDDTTADEVVEDAAADEAAADEAVVEDATTDEAAADEAVVEDATTDEAAADEVTTEEG